MDKFNDYKNIKKDINNYIDNKINDGYSDADEYCNEMNSIKFSLLERTSLARMYEIVESSLKKPIIGTQALDTCYGIMFYDRKNKKGICGHAVPSELLVVFREMIKWVNQREGEIEYMIVPGFRNFDRKDLRGLKLLEDYMIEKVCDKVKLVPLKGNGDYIKFHQSTLSYEFAFNTENGEFVSEYVFFDQIEHNPRYTAPKRYF